MALLEEKVARLGELLAEVLEETASMVEKKQSRTYEELERDLQLQEENDMEVELTRTRTRTRTPKTWRWSSP